MVAAPTARRRWRRIAGVAALGLLALAGGLQAWRGADQRADDAAWMRLAATAASAPARYDPALVQDLPAPARRYFDFTIAPGTPLATVAEITMGGELSLGTRDAPGYQPMQARQILAAPHGLVWRLQAGQGAMRITGSDGIEGGRSWVRFWWLGALPVVRAGGGPDHLRAAFGRVVAEAAFWTPAALLPGPGVRWEAVDEDTARATVSAMGMTQSVDVRVAADGRPLWVRIERWTDANPEGVYRLQPFGGTLADFRDVGGYRLPFEVDGGNFFGTDDYHAFYRARVRSIHFPPHASP